MFVCAILCHKRSIQYRVLVAEWRNEKSSPRDLSAFPPSCRLFVNLAHLNTAPNSPLGRFRTKWWDKKWERWQKTHHFYVSKLDQIQLRIKYHKLPQVNAVLKLIQKLLLLSIVLFILLNDRQNIRYLKVNNSPDRTWKPLYQPWMAICNINLIFLSAMRPLKCVIWANLNTNQNRWPLLWFQRLLNCPFLSPSRSLKTSILSIEASFWDQLHFQPHRVSLSALFCRRSTQSRQVVVGEPTRELEQKSGYCSLPSPYFSTLIKWLSLCWTISMAAIEFENG